MKVKDVLVFPLQNGIDKLKLYLYESNYPVETLPDVSTLIVHLYQEALDNHAAFLDGKRDSVYAKIPEFIKGYDDNGSDPFSIGLEDTIREIGQALIKLLDNVNASPWAMWRMSITRTHDVMLINDGDYRIKWYNDKHGITS